MAPPRKPPKPILTEYLRQAERAVTPPRRRRRVPAAAKRQQAIQKRAEPTFVRIVTDTVDRMAAGTSTKTVAAALVTGQVEQAVAAVPWETETKRLQAEHGRALRDTLEAAGTLEAAALRYPAFSVLAPEVLRWLEEHGTEFIRTLAGISHEDLRTKLVDMMSRGLSAREAAQSFVNQIGLTPRLAAAVENYRAELIAAEVAPARRAVLVARKERRLLQYRAMMIARTEAVNAIVAGQQAAWRQAEEDGYVSAEEFEQEWVTSSDPCPEICEPMDGDRRRLGESFITGDGRAVMGPGGDVHPHCQCVLIGVVTPKAESQAA